MGQLHIRLDEQKKEDWGTYAEENGYGSLSRFVRVAVENELNGNHGPTTDNAPTPSVPDNIATANDVDQVNDTLLRMVDRLEDLEQQVQRAEESSLEPNDKRAVLEALPSERPDPDAEGFEKTDAPTYEEPSGGVAYDGRPESVAEVSEESVPSVKYFLARSAHRSEGITAEKIGGQLRYWVMNNE